MFERLGDAGVRTATTPFLIYRGRRRHELGLGGTREAGARGGEFPPRRLRPRRVLLRRPLRQPPDRLQLQHGQARQPGRVLGLRQRGAGQGGGLRLPVCSRCPTTTSTPTATDPRAQTESIAKADLNFARIVEAGGGLDSFLDEHAVILTSDHAQTAVEHALPLAEVLAEDWRVLEPNAERPEEAEIAVSPTSRAGAVYILGNGPGHGTAHERVRSKLRELAGVDLVTWLADAEGEPLVRTGVGLGPDADGAQAVVTCNGHELRFRPGGRHRDKRGGGLGRQRRPRRPRRAGLGRAHRHRPLPGRPRATVVGAELPARGGRPDLDGGRIRVRGLGWRQPRRRRQPRRPQPRGLAQPPAVRRLRPRRPGRNPQWALRDIAPIVLSHFGVGRRRLFG